jgi:phosphoribosylformylglycinamidine synthase
MAQVKALIVTGYGTNCDKESAHAAREAGADQAQVIFFSDLAAGKAKLTEANFLIFPGGFLDGDDLGAAQAAAIRWRYATDPSGAPILDQLKAFFAAGGLVLGICNGFQLLVKLGLLPALDGKYFERQVSLSLNDSARFEDRWVRLAANPASPCVFTQGLGQISLPVRHGEGKLIPMDEATLDALEANNLVTLRYVNPQTGQPTQEYPYNPNGSPRAIAGLTDPSGRVLGLMPHPEAFNHRTNHPRWTRGEDETLGLAILEGGVKYLKAQ